MPHLVQIEHLDALTDIETAKAVADTLVRTYPRHLWCCSAQGRVVVVRVPSLHGEWGFVMHTHKMATASELHRAAVMAGGELLERAGVSRAPSGTSYDRILDK